MAVAAIVAHPAQPLDPALQAVADALKQTHAADPAHGLPFIRALDRALAHLSSGIEYEPYNATHYRVQSFSRRWLWHYLTLDHCPCETDSWCWHRGLLHLLTAHAALLRLDRCPRPTAAHTLPRQQFDMDAIVRACDELV
jgi:hypothetical protein